MTPGEAGASPADPAPLPVGLRDVLTTEAGELRDIEAALRGTFARWGYREVVTPVLEFADVMDRAQEGGLGPAFRLFDEHGRVLVLRPDLTIPVARLVAARLAAHPGPVRVSYVGTAFRPPPAGRAQPAELRQAGVELVGAEGPAADAEAIALLAESLTRAGLDTARIAVGDVWLTGAVMDAAGVPPATQARMRAAAAARDLVAWRALAAGHGDAPAVRALLDELPRLRGGRDVLDRIARDAPAAQAECRRLDDLLDLLERHGVRDRVAIDMGVLRDRAYYSGIVVEAYAPGVGAPIAAGGRYDGLAERFGRPRPAVGFAIALDELHRALAAAAAAPAGAARGVVLVGGMDDEVAAARAARAAGLAGVAVAGDGDDLAAADGWRYLARRAGEGYEVVDRIDGTRTTGTTLTEALPSPD
ncbi:MAG: ATP phosphoribosyltransferase regulatory subunit [Actinomycetota bacterium]